MAETSTGESRPTPAIAWSELVGRAVTVHAPTGSFAATRAHAELDEAERALAALARLLKHPLPLAEPIDVYLVDAVAPAPSGEASPIYEGAERIGEAGVVCLMHPELAREPIVWPIVRFALGRWFGSAAASTALFVDGVGAIVAARTGAAPQAGDADEVVRAQLGSAAREGKPGPSIFPRLQSVEPKGVAEPDPVATSFVAFLFASFGPEAFGRFLAAYDPERRDESSVAAYRQPLAALEAAWLRSLAKAAPPTAAYRDFFRYLAPLFRPYLWRLGEVALYMTLGMGATIALPLLTRNLIDERIPVGDERGFLLVTAGLVAVYVADTALGMRRAYAQLSITLRVLTDLQARIYAHLQRLSHSFYAEARVGDLIIRLGEDLSFVQQSLSLFGTTGVFAALTAVAALGTLLYMDLLLGLLVLVIVPLLAVTNRVLGARAVRASYERQQELGRVASAAEENLTAHSVVKAYGLEEYAVASYHGRLMTLLKTSLHAGFVAAAFESSVTATTRLASLLVIAAGGYLVMTGNFTLGTLVGFIALLPSLLNPVSTLSAVFQMLHMASGSMARVSELLDAPVAIADKPGAIELPPMRGEIRLEGVGFAYDPARPVLRDLDLTIPAGAHVAIVGPSGSGKSTVANLLLRFWDPDEGRVLFDGHDIRDITVASLRGQIGLVFQETFVFDTTIRENIAIGELGASDADIDAAARAARLDAWIDSLPAGYETPLGERGTRLSGGQRQRLGIARALVRDPRVLLLDEATSALDAQTEAEILETLAAVARGRTTISITHRLALAAAADHIFVLDHARVVEAGSHDELARAGGLYSRLYQEQTSHVIGDGRKAGLRLDRLRAIPLLADLDEAALTAVGERLVLERFGRDEVVTRQGESGDRFFLITRGQVDVLLEHNGSQRRLNTLHEGDFFGEIALIADEPRSAMIKTTMPTDVYSLTRQDLDELMEREPKIRAALLETIASRRRALEEAVSAVAT